MTWEHDLAKIAVRVARELPPPARDPQDLLGAGKTDAELRAILARHVAPDWLDAAFAFWRPIVKRREGRR